METIPSPRLGFLRGVFLANHLESNDNLTRTTKRQNTYQRKLTTITLYATDHIIPLTTKKASYGNDTTLLLSDLCRGGATGTCVVKKDSQYVRHDVRQVDLEVCAESGHNLLQQEYDGVLKWIIDCPIFLHMHTHTHS